ncbi:MAG: DNA repair protein RadA [Planctomycetota bacterium]
MAKTRSQFLCNSCGSVHPKWMGKCPDCGTWDSLEEFKEAKTDARDAVGVRSTGDLAGGAEALTLDAIDTADAPRITTGIGEFDRVLGGGFVAGSAVLVGGEPGIGKSTLLLQAAAELAKHGTPVMYVTSEESARQTKLRAERLGLAKTDSLRILAETNLERVRHQLDKHKPAVAIVDSIQMVYKPDLPAAPGSVTQLRDGCMDLVYHAKRTGCAIGIVGHVTKQGTLAGPKIIEHIVDTVIYFEGDRFHSHRIVRGIKNRFGSTHEVGLFEMTGTGLAEVKDPAGLFATQHPDGAPSGSVLTCVSQGSRSLLVEVQALTASSVVGAARRKVSGISADRVSMIIAVLEKRCDVRLAADDVFVNIAGGVKIAEPAADLAVALAIASAHFNRPLPPGTLALGELGLGGEVRPVPQIEGRLKEAARLGVGHAVVPPLPTKPALKGTALHEVRRLQQAMGDLV